MNNIKIIASGKYLPKNIIDNKYLSNALNVSEDYIYKRTGIYNRYYCNYDETIDTVALKSVYNLLENYSFVDIKSIDMIIVATTSTDMLMPGISFNVQKELGIKNCMCLDILSGCAGYINAFDIARNYIAIGKVNQALIIGVDILSIYTKKEDISTSIILSDGAGATIIKKIEEPKRYTSCITSEGVNNDILSLKSNGLIEMDGKEVYKYAVKETVNNINKLLSNNNITLNEIKYIVPHQSNIKIINSIANRLNFDKNRMYTNIKYVGNTFCASIPIALDEMLQKDILKNGDNIIFLGYGGGLNTGSILMEV